MILSCIDFDNLNKMHLLLGGVDYSCRAARDAFCKDVVKYQQDNEAHCKAHDIPCHFDKNHEKAVLDLAARCTNFYEVQALANFFFKEETIPTYEQVKARSHVLYKIYPHWDLARAVRGRPGGSKRTF